MQQESGEASRKPRWWIGLVVALGIAALVAALLLNAPRGFDVSIDQIGNGTPALVFVYDSNLTVSGSQTAQINKIRDNFDGRLQFLLADVGRPDAQRFVSQYQTGPGALLLFEANGSLTATERGLLEAPALEQWLNSKLANR